MMRTNMIWKPAAVALALAIAGVASAQSNYDNKKDTKLNAHLLRASQVMGINVENPSGEDIGEINDLALDLHAGHCRFAIVSTGGVLGVGDKLYAVPMKAIKFPAGDTIAHLNITKQHLEQAPQFTREEWNKLSDEGWATTVYEFYTIKPDFEVEKSKVAVTTPAPQYMRGSEVVGMDVHNRQDEDLGEIEDLMLDVNSGRVAYAVLSYGGVLGVGEKLFAVPWKALNLNAESKQLVLNVEKEKLKGAPGFDKDKWPNMADLGWSKDVHEFYGSDPNWIYGYSGDETSQKSHR
jgi:sporulation protein YlmC with PRC-barrel domain